MHSLLVSTFRRLLKVTLTSEGDLANIHVVSEGHGVYFGLARYSSVIFVAERNLDINKEPITPGDPLDVIRVYLELPTGSIIRTPIYYKSCDFDDLHQIAYDKGAVFVTSAKYPFLFRKGLFWGHHAIDITTAVPDLYRRENDHHHDAYHINSVSIFGEHLMVLAHNWDQPSFLLQLSLKEARRGRMVCTKIYKNLGFCCHDIIPDRDAFWTLDSKGSALVRVDMTDDTQKRYLIPRQHGATVGRSDDVPFPRGIDMFGDMMAISYGFNEERADRMDSHAMITLFDLRHRTFVKHLPLGAHGNTCAVLSL